MALKRLDEEFELKPGTQLLPYMKRLLPSLEGRFQEIESDQDIIAKVGDDIRAAALLRMNEILVPATTDILAVTKLGFLLAPISTAYPWVLGYMGVTVDEGVQRDTFTPSPYLIVESSVNDYAIARLIGYEQETGFLEMTVTAIHGVLTNKTNIVVSSTPGMADSTKLYHDAVAPMHAEVVTDLAEVRTKHAEIMAAAAALAAAGLDVYAFIRRDGSVPFVALQQAVTPASGSNDGTIPTTGWTRARIIEYAGNAVSKLGDTVSGPLYLTAQITSATQAATKQYVDDKVGDTHTITDILTIAGVNPSLILRPSLAQQNRQIQAVSTSGAQRWVMALADGSVESGGNAGANFSLTRFSDVGAQIDSPLVVMRGDGAMFTKALNTSGALSVTGNLNVASGDLSIYRAGVTNTGVIYMNAAKSAYHHWDGVNHSFIGGGLTTNGQPISCSTLNCNNFSTNGYGATVWGITSHGTATINGAMNCTDMQISGTANYIKFWDSDWGMMYMHHNGDLIGYLNNGGGWIQYTTNAGHLWIAQYGWLHDYVNGRASAYAWEAANYRYNQCETSSRMVYAADRQVSGGLQEPYAGAVMTGASTIGTFRWRYFQSMIAGGWYTVALA